ncbi:transposase [Sedimentibacter sp.]|uniref:transposase n=1 Tax=Sedimentibacter sp. TaxID=1960295 RepID=UPI0028B0DCC0|nr:transposase [Sedimentibacter sp.]
MPRVARKRSESGIYHIMMRGINRQVIFKDREDYLRFIETLLKYKNICEYQLFAYCLMDNHLHLLLKEGKEPLETIMRRICGSFVLWYNKKYGRIGYLFQDRFKSEPVEDDTYFLTVLRYIFQNPIKAGIAKNIKDYNWTNYDDYLKSSRRSEADFVLKFFNISSREEAIKNFIEYVNKNNDDECMDLSEKNIMTDDEALKIIKEICKIEYPYDIQELKIDKRNIYIKVLKEKHNLSIRQIERLTGINRGVIQKA